MFPNNTALVDQRGTLFGYNLNDAVTFYIETDSEEEETDHVTCPTGFLDSCDHHDPMEVRTWKEAIFLPYMTPRPTTINFR